jgi:hypothetical protein
MESLLHADDVRSGCTTDATTVPAEKIHKFSIRPLDCAESFKGLSGGCFSWSSIDSLLDADDVRSGRTTDLTAVPAEKVHNFWSERWIALKVLEDFL